MNKSNSWIRHKAGAVKDDFLFEIDVLQTKYRLYKMLAVSILRYGCETWALLAEAK